jgi:hypothetical protein
MMTYAIECNTWTAMGHILERQGETYEEISRAQVKRGDENNGIAVHACRHQHSVDWEGAEVLLQEPRYWKRRVL